MKENNKHKSDVMLSGRCAVSQPLTLHRHCGRGPAIQAVNKENTLINKLDPGSMSGMTTKKAFTLIELLVVVLIIGILSAIALPQYEKAVEKSRAAEPMTLLNALGKAQEVYYMANGTYADSFNLLDVEIPSSYQPSDKCTVFSSDTRDCVANQDWAIGIDRDNSWGWRFFYAIRLKGKYAVEKTNTNQAMLVYIVTRLSSVHHAWQQDHQLVCSSNGDYCKTVFGIKSKGGWINPFSGCLHDAYPL